MIWLSYSVFCKDVELACDESVIKSLKREEIADYSQALLNCSSKRRSLTISPLAFGEVAVKDRIKSALNYKKPALWISIIAIIACVVLAVCFLTSPMSEAYEGPISCTLFQDVDGVMTEYAIVDLTEKSVSDVLLILNNTKWENDNTANNSFNVKLKLNDRTVDYSSELGIVYNEQSGKSSHLSSKHKNDFDRIFDLKLQDDKNNDQTDVNTENDDTKNEDVWVIEPTKVVWPETDQIHMFPDPYRIETVVEENDSPWGYYIYHRVSAKCGICGEVIEAVGTYPCNYNHPLCEGGCFEGRKYSEFYHQPLQ